MKYTEREVTSQDAPETRVLTLPSGFVDTFTYRPPEINPGIDRVFPDSTDVEEWKDAPPYDKSFKKVLQNREIKMTNYSIGKVSTSRYLASIDRIATKAASREWIECQNGAIVQAASGIVAKHVRYRDNYDAIRAADSFPVVEYTDTKTTEDISDILNDLKAKVIQESYSGFDALTELGELPETLVMLRDLFLLALRPLQGIRALQEKYKKARSRGKTHEVANRDIMSAWMQYRYGIMPLVYSIQDAMKLLSEAFAEFKTDREFSVVRSKPRNMPIPTETHVAIYRAHEVKIGVIGKAKFATQSQRLTDLVTANLFITAWELIPMSFVIDWFINVGDVISSLTMGYADLSEERKFCYSIRRTMIDKHVLNYNFTDGATRIVDKHLVNPCNTGADWIYRESYSNETLNIGSKLLYERMEESYERRVFLPNTVELKFEPNLNWMRMLDAYSLSFNPIRKQLKKLRT